MRLKDVIMPQPDYSVISDMQQGLKKGQFTQNKKKNNITPSVLAMYVPWL